MKIFICGFMAAGKTTFLNKIRNGMPPSTWKLVDLDHEIKLLHGQESITQFVDKYGWEYFRSEELRLVESALDDCQSGMWALGGGTLSFELIAKMRNTNSTLVWLDTPFEECLRRISERPLSDRPLARQMDREVLYGLWQERNKLYRLADLTLDSDAQSHILNYRDLLIRLGRQN